MKKIILAVAVAAVASMAVAASASADVPRYQTQSMTITAVQPEGAVGQWMNVWTHTYNVTLNPCDGSFSGTGSLIGTLSGPYSNETITGHLDGNNTVSFTATRPDGVVYSLSSAPLDNTTVTLATSTPVVPWNLEFKVSKTMGASSTYKNHGQYVKSQGDRDDAAHSCIGMPITNAPFEWNTIGTIDSSVMAGTNVALPRAGTYRIDVNGAWTNSPWGWVDAEYTDNGAGGAADGFDRNGFLLGTGFGDVQVNNTFVNWGAFNPSHSYTLAMPLSGTVNLAVFDGDSNTNTKAADWYGDNNGSLTYAITYVGP